MSDTPSPAVVVGIDGSRTAIDAALWAVDEAVERDIPLRLLYAIEPGDDHASPHDAARDLATAEIAIRYAFIAVEATMQPVKIEVEILQERPQRALAAASRSAALICVGAVGLKNATRGQIGSTAAAIIRSAHCPVAVIRRRAVPVSNPGCILVEIDDWTNADGVLQKGVDEALLRRAPLRVLATWQSRFTNAHDVGAVAGANQLALAQLDRRLAGWRRRHPELDVQALTNHGTTLDYLAKAADSVQLVVVGAERSGGTGELVGPRGLAVLHDTDCAVLTCDPHRRL